MPFTRAKSVWLPPRQGLTAAPLVELILEVISLCESDLKAGALVSVQAVAIKVHKLPVVRGAE